MTKSRMMMKS